MGICQEEIHHGNAPWRNFPNTRNIIYQLQGRKHIQLRAIKAQI